MVATSLAGFVLPHYHPGTQTTIFSAFALVAGITLLGTIVGVIAAYAGGWVDTVLMRISDIFLAFPEMVFAIAVAGVMQAGSGLRSYRSIMASPGSARLREVRFGYEK